jgi:ketosteroid isomerase-like protein
MTDAQREEIAGVVEARLRSFESAERSRDAEPLIAHFAAVPTFRIYNDGEAVGYDAIVAMIRTTFPNLRSIEGGFGDLQVSVLAPDHALVSASFRETVVDHDGVSTRSRGAVSWLWRLIDGQWYIVYGQVDHRPDHGA